METKQIIKYFKFKNKFNLIVGIIFLLTILNTVITVTLDILFLIVPVLLHALNIALMILLIIGFNFANHLFREYEEENKIYMYKHLFENDEKKTY